MDGRTDDQTNRRKEGRTNRQLDGRTNEQKVEWMHGWAEMGLVVKINEEKDNIEGLTQKSSF